MKLYTILIPGLFFVNAVCAAIIKVGPGRTYTMPSQAAAVVQNGDTVEIDAGSYVDCATWSKNNLVLRGWGGNAHVKDKTCGGKAIWVITGANVLVENVEFSGATVAGNNGAGIRQEGNDAVIRNCYFHDNENGILVSTLVTGSLTVEYCEFGNNGYGDGLTHNIYVNKASLFTLRYCYMHHAKVGHEVKSRAHVNHILYNRITDESSGTASRNIDLPNGGTAIILGNVIEQGPNSGNSNIMGYGLEGLSNNAPHDVYVVNNTFVNNKSTGSFINIASGTGVLKTANNIFAGPGTLISGTATTLDTSSNYVGSSVASFAFQNAAGYDFQLTASSPVINKGTNPGMAGSFSLTPVREYVHPAKERARPANGALDIGAYEYNPSTRVEAGAETTIIKLYPNPAQDAFSLEIPWQGKAVIRLVNMAGQLIYSGIHQPDVTGRVHVSVGGLELSPGVYSVAVTDWEGRSYRSVLWTR